MSYIEKEKVIAVVCEGCNDEFSDSHCEPSECSIRQVINSIPTEDVVEVRHGYNKNDYPSLFECSVCGAADFDTLTGEGEYIYCPWCGAKMDDKRSENET